MAPRSFRPFRVRTTTSCCSWPRTPRNTYCNGPIVLPYLLWLAQTSQSAGTTPADRLSYPRTSWAQASTAMERGDHAVAHSLPYSVVAHCGVSQSVAAPTAWRPLSIVSHEGQFAS